ncbi:hypothetical protein A2U01_0094915, partial [Trifolium medium]|nr:hypothetical protein [Trifolium medium]
GIGKPRGRPKGSGGKGNGKTVPTISTSFEQRNTAKHTTPAVNTSTSSSSTNSGTALNVDHIPSIPSNSQQRNTSMSTTP